MPKIPAKFEDWTPPWGEGEIDPDVVARLVYNLQLAEQDLTAERKALKTENQTLTEANEVFKAASEESAKSHDDATKKAVAEVRAELEKERDQAKEELAKVKRESDLKEVRIQFPALEEKDLNRLHGDDLDALLEDAKEFAERLAPPAANEDEDPDENVVRRQPRVKTPGDPRPDAGGPIDVDKILAERAQQSAWTA